MNRLQRLGGVGRAEKDLRKLVTANAPARSGWQSANLSRQGSGAASFQLRGTRPEAPLRQRANPNSFAPQAFDGRTERGTPGAGSSGQSAANANEGQNCRAEQKAKAEAASARLSMEEEFALDPRQREWVAGGNSSTFTDFKGGTFVRGDDRSISVFIPSAPRPEDSQNGASGHQARQNVATYAFGDVGDVPWLGETGRK